MRTCSEPGQGGFAAWWKYEAGVRPVSRRNAATNALGADMLEIGLGPGAATEWLRHMVRRLTEVEADATAAGKLADRYRGGNVDVAVGSATGLA
jgi:16S rRNA A1518/A1519 N6-dimethyltransferase RsmA/KsgA/DIM1 with predicted DNA glycosylase/AP lyase activity